MTIEKKQDTNGIAIGSFLYGSLWRIVWFACQVNPGKSLMWWHFRTNSEKIALSRKTHSLAMPVLPFYNEMPYGLTEDNGETKRKNDIYTK